MAEADEAVLDQVADELYGLPPEEFTAARDGAAKAAEDRQLRDAVKALRRPTVSAWLVNRLAQDQTDLLEQLLELGPALAQAQTTGAADDLRALGQQRRQLVAAVTEAAVDLSGRDIAAAARTEVEQTLEAALADPASADAVRSGRLVRALSFAGFGGVDLEGAVAVTPITTRTGTTRAARKQRPGAATTPGRGGTKAATDDRAAAAAAAEQAALDAAAALDDAVRAGEAAQRDRTAAVESAANAEREVDNAAAAVAEQERQLASARERHGAAVRSARQAKQQAAAAGKVADHAVRAVERAQEAAERARAALDALRRGRS